MKRLRPACVLLAVLAISAPVRAQVQGAMTAVDLQNLCNSRYDVDAGMCAGYIMAIAESLQAHPDPARPVCLSPAVRPQTLIDNLQRAWAEQAPGPQEPAIENVAGVLASRFRCP